MIQLTLKCNSQGVIQMPEMSQEILSCQKRKEQIFRKSSVISINPMWMHQIPQGPKGTVIRKNNSPRFTDDIDGSPQKVRYLAHM